MIIGIVDDFFLMNINKLCLIEFILQHIYELYKKYTFKTVFIM